jgi:hypothetical protein
VNSYKWLAFVCAYVPLCGQTARVREVDTVFMPSQVDSNSPSFWKDGIFHLFNSTGNGPVLSSGPNPLQLGDPLAVPVTRMRPWPVWMEAVWPEDDGIVLGWYHQEQWGLCAGSRLAVPQIGAAISYDGGKSFFDMGAILSSGDPYSCAAQNGYFAGGNGDVSVMLDRQKEYFYFFFTNYAGPLETQGVVTARMPYSARYYPVGNVSKYYNGSWSEPGLRGRTTPIFPAKQSWMAADTNSFWGPSIHWNTYLDTFVILLNRSCCEPGFPQDAIYASFGGTDLSKPESWTRPRKILNDTGWYPQVIGGGPRGTDRQAGRVARLFISGRSRWEIVFQKPEDPPNVTAQ